MRIIFYTKQDFVAETKRITNGKGVDVVYDGVGKSITMKGLDSSAPPTLFRHAGDANGRWNL